MAKSGLALGRTVPDRREERLQRASGFSESGRNLEKEGALLEKSKEPDSGCLKFSVADPLVAC